ncbi:hypothetical protein [Halomarina rubra]|uniref:DUF8163 domain-containing protein n=1 Tax=Halomarina rubra TaxID=2071873 RepID=A0ABD6AWK7_9EURY|nr:hypothetical protein [Halomarina rubra]
MTDQSRLTPQQNSIRREIGGGGWTAFTMLGGLLAASGFVLTGQVGGFVAAAVVFGAAVVLTTPFALTISVLLIGVVDPSEFLPMLLAGSGLLFIALSGLEGVRRPGLATAVLVMIASSMIGVAWVAWSIWPPWLATVAVLVVIAILGYGTHRYERVMLGLVTDPIPESEAEP